MGKGVRQGLTAAAVIALAGCGGEEAYAPEAGTQADTMFEQGCSHCHGSDGKGKFGFLLGLQDTELSQAEIQAVIANGKGIMPAFPELSNRQRRQLAGLIQDL